VEAATLPDNVPIARLTIAAWLCSALIDIDRGGCHIVATLVEIEELGFVAELVALGSVEEV
jgi:hypothetical protein